jgi:hypothetical protein
MISHFKRGATKPLKRPRGPSFFVRLMRLLAATRPWRVRAHAPLGVADHRYGANHQHLPQIAVAGFGDAAKALLAAA